MNLAQFLLLVVGVSISGVVSPGPITAMTITMGSRNKHAGSLIGLGHGLLEIPVMLLLLLGMGELFSIPGVKITIALAGGIILLVMAVQMFREAGKSALQGEETVGSRGPILTGLVLSATSPFFMIWWTTIGLGLVVQARELGALAFVLFTIVHILCDVTWLELVSQASFRGAKLLSDRAFATVLRVCTAALVCFSAMFIWNSVKGWTT